MGPTDRKDSKKVCGRGGGGIKGRCPGNKEPGTCPSFYVVDVIFYALAHSPDMGVIVTVPPSK
jgi:hypothetical protein